jgi:hypothetical protein
MKFLIIALLVISTTVSATSKFKAEYPLGPDITLTPGSLCDQPDSYRYPERIAYCNRVVDYVLKEDVFREYRHNGYRLEIADRGDYKIDHLIPLCAGGSNRETNLWPQHVTIFKITDPMESLGCEKLKLAKIKQLQLVKLIIAAKRDLRLVAPTMNYLNSL